MERQIPRYGRIQFTLPQNSDRFFVQLPNGEKEAVTPFRYQPTRFVYDRHGYESQEPSGPEALLARFTPCQLGEHCLLDEEGRLLERFTCVPSDNPGYVCVSKKDGRYFAFSDGSSYVPIGLNMVVCDYDRLPAGNEHFQASNQVASTGQIQCRRYFRAMAKAKVNYVRLWLSSPYLNARTELMGVHDLQVFNRLDAIMDMAREYGIYVKLCFEHFRTFWDEGHFAYKRIVDPDSGKQLRSEKEWVTQEKWNARWMEDIAPYIARYQNDPVVFAFELWNEMNCVQTGDFADIAAFTARMLPRVKALSPKNLVVNSLGSFDEDGFQHEIDEFKKIPSMDFLQVHRYLDQGAPLEICRTDPVAFSIEAVERARLLTKPIILTETGAVNDRHVGPFRFYACDHDGLIFHDVTYPALFAGAAGSGHIWHWNAYVEPKNLWRHYLPLARAVEGIQMDEEGFETGRMDTPEAWVLVLKGKRHSLVLLRNKADRWDYVLRDGREPAPAPALRLPLGAAKVETLYLMDEQGEAAFVEGGDICVPSFVHGCVLRIEH